MTGYNGVSFSYGATQATDLLTIGKVYRFKTRSKNGIDYSEFSDEAFIAYGDVPNTPLAPVLVKSDRTSIMV